MENLIYLDNAATTKVFDEVFDLQRENNKNFFNPSATYSCGITARKNLENAREKITALLGGKNGRLYFTSSATESNNTVFSGVHLRAGQTILISKAEHPSVFAPAKELEKRGIKVLEIPLLKDGTVDTDSYIELLKSNSVALVSIIHVLNETGAINDIKNLVNLTKKINPNIIFHSDGVQAFGKVEVNLADLGVDLYTISAHKIYSVRGIAGLWVKNGTTISPLLFGGGQEFGIRSSTENVAGALSFAWCAEKVVGKVQENLAKVSKTRAELIGKLKSSNVSNFLTINEASNQSPYILSVSFEGIKGEVLMNALQADGIMISTGSACSSKKAGNRILEAMGIDKNKIVGSVRISFSAYDSYDVDYIAECLQKNVLRLIQNIKR